MLLRFVIYTDQPISVILIGAQKGRFCAREWNFLQLVRRKGDSAHGRGGEWREAGARDLPHFVRHVPRSPGAKQFGTSRDGSFCGSARRAL